MWCWPASRSWCPTYAAAMLQLRLLARSATGQPITSYTTFSPARPSRARRCTSCCWTTGACAMREHAADPRRAALHPLRGLRQRLPALRGGRRARLRPHLFGRHRPGQHAVPPRPGGGRRAAEPVRLVQRLRDGLPGRASPCRSRSWRCAPRWSRNGACPRRCGPRWSCGRSPRLADRALRAAALAAAPVARRPLHPAGAPGRRPDPAGPPPDRLAHAARPAAPPGPRPPAPAPARAGHAHAQRGARACASPTSSSASPTGSSPAWPWPSCACWKPAASQVVVPAEPALLRPARARRGRPAARPRAWPARRSRRWKRCRPTIS